MAWDVKPMTVFYRHSSHQGIGEDLGFHQGDSRGKEKTEITFCDLYFNKYNKLPLTLVIYSP